MYPWARTFAYFLTRDRDQADDLVHDAFVSVLSSTAAPMEFDDLKRWTRVVVVRRAARLRHRAMHEFQSFMRLAHPSAQQDVISPDALSVVEAVRSLPPRQRACIVLRYIEDLPEGEVAAILRISPGTVKAHLAQARQKLRTRLSEPMEARNRG